MNVKDAEFLVVGSGAGGATLANELSKRGKDVLVLEAGKIEEKVGSFRDSLRYYDANPITRVPKKSNEGVILWRTVMAGGSTIVSCGNGTRCLEAPLAELGITLSEEFEEAEKEMHVAPIAQGLLSESSERIMLASSELGFAMERMPKFLDPVKCQKCGQCVLGCVNDAKWTARKQLEAAAAEGAEVHYNTRVQRVLTANGKVRGVSATGPDGPVEYAARVVILSAGGFATPVILQQSGIDNAGQGLFIDLLVNTYGVTDGLNQMHEPTMALVDLEFHDSNGFLLSPYVNHSRIVWFIEMGPRGFALPVQRLIGIMTKIVDEPVGHIFANGKISKPVTDRDHSRLREGSAIATDILVQVGADPRSIVVSNPQGAHPGGAAAIGKVVDKDLRTSIDNLYVCDGSVLPEPPGMPPIMTIVALAKRLAKTLSV